MILFKILYLESKKILKCYKYIYICKVNILFFIIQTPSGPQIAHIVGPNGQLQQVQVVANPATSMPTALVSLASSCGSFVAPGSISSTLGPGGNFMIQSNPVMSQATSSTVTTQVKSLS